MTKPAVLIFLMLLIANVILGCIEQQEKKPVLFVSIAPQYEFVKAVVGDRYEIEIAIPPGKSPASYDPTPSDIKKLSTATAYFKIGHLPFEENWLDKFKEINPNMQIFDSCQGIEFKRMSEHVFSINQNNETNENPDPHVWLSPVLVKKMVENIKQDMCEIDSNNCEQYKKNAEKYIEKLNKLDSNITQRLSNIENRNFMTFHPSFGYFAEQYNLTQIAIERNGKEPDAQYLKKIEDYAKQNNVKIILVQKEFNKEYAENIAKQIDARVYEVDPLSQEYYVNMLNLAKVFEG